MTDKRVWLITGAGRGMGVEFAKAAPAAPCQDGGHTRCGPQEAT
jgi:NAD(P)-dependent dehydrogenase (short-subunit alcohol dehydrogenase family)